MKRGRPLRFPVWVLIVVESGRTLTWAAENAGPAVAASDFSQPVPLAPVKLPATPVPPVTPGIFAPKAEKASTRASAPSRRALSPEMAAKLGVVVNQAVAALPPPPPRREGANDADVVVMDTYRVEERDAPDFKERELRRKKAFDDMAKRLGGSALGGPGVADAAADDLQRQRGREAGELFDLTRIGKEALPGMKRLIDEMNTRVNDPRAQNGTPFKEAQINNRF